MTIALLILLSAGLLVMAYLLWTLHSRLRLLERMDATRKREARDLSKRQVEVEYYFSFVSEQQYKILEVLGKANDFTLKLAEKVMTKDEYQAPTAKPATMERVPRPLRTKPVMNPQPYQGGDQHQINDRDRQLLTAGENER
jgi:hypothetical protein|nr:MAG TPA: hypothetical protein [Caudoviricetes sp.]